MWSWRKTFLKFHGSWLLNQGRNNSPIVSSGELREVNMEGCGEGDLLWHWVSLTHAALATLLALWDTISSWEEGFQSEWRCWDTGGNSMEVDGDILLMYRRGLSPMVATFQVSKSHHPGSHDHTWNFTNLLSLQLTRGKHRIMGNRISSKEFINCKDGSKWHRKNVTESDRKNHNRNWRV